MVDESVSGVLVSFRTGIFLHDVLYGVELYLYFKTMQILVTRRRACRTDLFYAIFSTVLFILITVYMAGLGIAGLPPQSPAEQIEHIRSQGLYLSIICVVLQVMENGLMIYRCRILWDSIYVIILPSFLSFVSVVLVFVCFWLPSETSQFNFRGIGFGLSMAYYTISVCVQATLTTLICYRLLSHAKALSAISGREYAAPYFDLVRMVVESVLPLTFTGITELISLAVGDASETCLAMVYVPLMCVSPQMLILRVASGNAWEDEVKSLSTIQFDRDTNRTTDEDGDNH